MIDCQEDEFLYRFFTPTLRFCQSLRRIESMFKRIAGETRSRPSFSVHWRPYFLHETKQSQTQPLTAVSVAVPTCCHCINNVFKEGEVDKNQVCVNFAHTDAYNKIYQVAGAWIETLPQRNAGLFFRYFLRQGPAKAFGCGLMLARRI